MNTTEEKETPTVPPTFVLRWATTVTEHYAITMTADQVAGLLGVTVSAVYAAPDDAVATLGDRILADALAKVEDEDTMTNFDGPHRDDITVTRATTPATTVAAAI